MPKLLSRSKHEEFELNSALQIRDQKERGAKKAREEEHKVEEKGKQWNFRRLRNLLPACHYSCLLRTVHPALLNSCCPFEVLPFCSCFDFSPFCPCNS